MIQGNEEIIFTFISLTILLLFLCIFIFGFATLFQKRQQKHREEKAALKTAYDQEILKSQIEVQNQTLQHIGQELHDNIGQLLSVAKINLNFLEESDSEELEYIKQTNEIITQSISDLRALTKSLDGDFVKDFGLEESISYELQRIRKTRRFQTEISVLGEKRKLGYEHEIVLFRIVQEVLNNAIKHSKANNLTVVLHYFPDSFTLKIVDNGKGFDLESLKQKTISQAGAGLRNINRRMELIGGKCNISSEIGKGTEVSLSMIE
ncbi:MAG: ATP-binding protein [Arcicella sp.]|jgi:signal transduction histidine kinase|nr:ATP-binding protein [Arcicella sp.]